MAAGVVYLGFFVDRQDFAALSTAFTVAFIGYGILIYRYSGSNLRSAIGLGLLLRVALVLSFPELSDDVYRFIWDGRLWVAGMNPFAELPIYYLQAGHAVAGLDADLFGRLNSPEYYTIYPPLAQLTFTVAAWLSPNSYYGSAVIIKMFLLAAEVGTLLALLRLTRRFSLPEGRVLLYWLNPLIIIEVVGNLHFEGMMACFLLWGLYFLARSRYATAGGLLALSIASKLLPLMLLPFLLRRLWRRQFWRFFLSCGLVSGLLFAPLLLGSDLLGAYAGSLDLYFRRFEFNASLYYLLRAYGFYEVGWNRIADYGPLLARVAGAVILILALVDERTDWRSLPGRWLGAFAVYLLCATTVHPWYLGVPLALCGLTRWRYPLIWSYLITFTYASYASEPYRENLWLVGVEYGLLFAYLAYEYRRPKNKGPYQVGTSLE